MNKLTNEEIWQQFTEGIDCAQVVLRYFADDLGVDKNLLTKIASPFTGGMYKGMTCGAVTGAYMVLGIKYGHPKPNEGEKKVELIKKMFEFDTKFKEKQSTIICEEILGDNIAENLEKIEQENTMQKKCPQAVNDAIDILEDMFEEK